MIIVSGGIDLRGLGDCITGVLRRESQKRAQSGGRGGRGNSSRRVVGLLNGVVIRVARSALIGTWDAGYRRARPMAGGEQTVTCRRPGSTFARVVSQPSWLVLAPGIG